MKESRSSIKEAAQERPTNRGLLSGWLALLSGVLVAFAIEGIHNAFPAQPEKAVLMVAGLGIGVLVFMLASLLVMRRRSVVSVRIPLMALVVISIFLVGIYLYWVSFYVFLPADILIWSEGDFVNDILKFRVGYPIYSAQVNNESFTYVPGAQLLTYLLAWLAGQGTSIPAFRMIQVIYTVLAAFVATLCCQRLVELSTPGRWGRGPWSTLWLPVLFLSATNSVTNRLTHYLHNDALAQLISVLAFFLLLEYVRTRKPRLLGMMAVLPAVGFFVKQNLVVWAALYCVQLLFFDPVRSLRRVLLFVTGTCAAIGAVVFACYVVWGSPFFYWTFTVLGSHGVSPLRSLQHLLDIWPYLFIGLLGGLVLLRGRNFRLLLAPWLIWLSLILLETYTSGIAWSLNHIGPGCLIATIWFLAAMPRLWLPHFRSASTDSALRVCLRHGVAVALGGLLFSGLGFVRIPMRAFSTDVYRYVTEIEREFRGQNVQQVLLDAGSWVYFNNGTVMKDRAPTIGERGYSETGDFSGVLERIGQKRYAKVLVRNFHAPDFWYDHYLWRTSSGIRQALLNNYRETGSIKAVSPPLSVRDRTEDPYLFGDISILIPNHHEP